MARAALYRRYRSKTLTDVVGQEHVTTLLAEALSRGAISHAYLFTGPRGVGKTSVARILAHEVNKLPYSNDQHLDIIEIDAASNRRIDDIRDLRDKVHITPVSATYKVYIIDEVHMLTSESFNALLKTLEEPPAHVIFILATTEIQKVPATIISRTQRFQFKPGSTAAIAAHLKNIAQQEKISIDDAALNQIASHGEGSFRDSLSLLDQISSSAAGHITSVEVDEILGLVPSDQISQLVEAIADHEVGHSTAILRSILETGTSSPQVAAQLAKYIAAHAATHDDFHLIEQLLEVSKSSIPDLKLLAVIARAAAPSDQPSRPSKAAVAAIATATIEQPIAAIAPAVDTSSQHVTKATQDTIDWHQIMIAVAKRNPPLHSVLKRARVTADDNSLSLEFNYKLHQKKLEDSKYRNLLTSLITDLYGQCPPITVSLLTPGKPKNEIAAGVAAIMGGGEEVNAK